MTRGRRALEALVSGFIVYGLMAACSGKVMRTSAGTATGAGGGGHGGSGHSGSGHSGSGHGGGGHSGGDHGGSGATGPVPDAMANVENPQSGTRLKGKFTLGADGSKQYQLTTTYGVFSYTMPPLPVQAVWYDSMLQDDCAFLQATDGKLHCLPGILSLPAQPLAGFTVYFADAQCTTPVVLQIASQPGCPPYAAPKYVQSQLYSSCGTPTTHVFQVGSAIPAPSSTYLSSANGTCSAQGVQQSIAEWFSATEVDPSSFVLGTTGIDP